MKALLNVLFLSALGLCALQAVTVYPDNPALSASAAGNGAGWNYVGQINGGASGVYLGNYSGTHYVLTANHVGGGNFTLGGTTYNLVSGSYHQVAPALDLGVFAIHGGAPLDALTQLVLGSSLTTSSSLNMIGYGGGTKRGGYNTPDSEDFYSYDGYTEALFITDYDSVPGEAQAIGGDSGGGVFYQNGPNLELAAIMVVAGTDSGKQITGSVDVGYYRTEILTRVPEASTVGFWIVAATFAVSVVWRSRSRLS